MGRPKNPQRPSLREDCLDSRRSFRDEREGLEVGEVVLVVGDAVEPREARIVELSNDGREAELEFAAFTEL